MLYEFAIEPEVLTSWDKARTTLNLMGFQHARAISAYPSKKRWKKMVFEACRKAGCPDREFARIREKVQQSEPRLKALEAGAAQYIEALRKRGYEIEGEAGGGWICHGQAAVVEQQRPTIGVGKVSGDLGHACEDGRQPRRQPGSPSGWAR